jgi:hypothetical protein
MTPAAQAALRAAADKATAALRAHRVEQDEGSGLAKAKTLQEMASVILEIYVGRE